MVGENGKMLKITMINEIIKLKINVEIGLWDFILSLQFTLQ